MELVQVARLVTEGKPDLAVIFSDPDRSVAAWTFREQVGLEADDTLLSVPWMRPLGDDFGFVIRRTDGASLWILGLRAGGATAKTSGLEETAESDRVPTAGAALEWTSDPVRLSSAAAEVYVRAHLPLVPGSVNPYDHGVGVTFADWSADGKDEVMLRMSSRQGTTLDLYGPGANFDYRHLVRFDNPAAPILDFDGDGMLEYVDRSDSGAWTAIRWNGTAILHEEIPAIDFGARTIPEGPLPSLPADLYVENHDEGERSVMRWPKEGGELQLDVPLSGAVDASLPWGARTRSEDTWSDASTDGRIRVTHEYSTTTGETMATRLAAPEGVLPHGARREGTLFVEGLSHDSQNDDPGDRVPLVATYTFDGLYQRRFEAVTLSPDGASLAWADGTGLWVAAIPEGTPRLLVEHTEEAHPYGFGGIHVPVAWAPGGRHLLGAVRYFEGRSNTLWEVQSGEGQIIDSSFSYAGGYSQLEWLRDGSGLLHVQSSGYPHGSLVSVIPVADFEQERELVGGWPEAEGSTVHQSPHVFGAMDFGNGTIGYAVQSPVGIDRKTNGIFKIALDTGEVRRVADVRPLALDYEGQGWLQWSSEGSAFIFEGIVPKTYETYVFVGDLTTGMVWDATAMFDRATAFAFGD